MNANWLKDEEHRHLDQSTHLAFVRRGQNFIVLTMTWLVLALLISHYQHEVAVGMVALWLLVALRATYKSQVRAVELSRELYSWDAAAGFDRG